MVRESASGVSEDIGEILGAVEFNNVFSDAVGAEFSLFMDTLGALSEQYELASPDPASTAEIKRPRRTNWRSSSSIFGIDEVGGSIMCQGMTTSAATRVYGEDGYELLYRCTLIVKKVQWLGASFLERTEEGVR